MKQLLSLLLLMFITFAGKAQSVDSTQIVEASCGQCKFGMKDKKGCDLAIRINNIPYFVKGTTIDKHGDAHADDGFCNAIRKARVSGSIEGKNFVTTSFVLLPEEKTKP